MRSLGSVAASVNQLRKLNVGICSRKVGPPPLPRVAVAAASVAGKNQRDPFLVVVAVASPSPPSSSPCMRCSVARLHHSCCTSISSHSKGRARWMSSSQNRNDAAASSVRAAVDYFEKGLRSKAVSASRMMFWRNLKAALAKEGEALAMEAMFTKRAEELFESLLEQNRDMITDERSEYHLQSACLVLAAHRVMTRQLNMDRGRSVEAIKQCMGDSSKPGVIEKSVRILLKLSAKISAKVLAGSNTFLLLSKAARNMTEMDWGSGGFSVEHDTSKDGLHSLTVSRCFYNDFFKRNNELDLVGPIFCAADLRLFEGAAGLGEGDLKEGRGGARVRLDKTLVGGAASCHFVIERTRQ